MEKEYVVIKNKETKLKEVFREVKTIFGKKKLKKVSLDEYYSFTRNSLKENKNGYRISPKVKGEDSISYLANKSVYNREHFVSDFDFRTTWSLTLKEENHYLENNKPVKDLNFDLVVYDTKGNILFGSKDFIFTTEESEDSEAIRELLEYLYQNACNGIYQTARDIEGYILASRKVYQVQEDAPLYKCEECGELFYSLNEFFYHLIEEGHLDSILTTFPFDKEVLRVKKLVETKRNENLSE